MRNIEEFRLCEGTIKVRLLLVFRILFRLFWAILLTGMLISPYGDACAQVSPVGECHFLGVGKTDLVGKTSAHPDDSPDAVFSVTLKPRPAGAAISAIEIRALAGARGLWSSAKTRGAAFIGVANAKEPSLLLNPTGGPLNLRHDEEQNLILYVTDDGAFDAKRLFQVKVENADRNLFHPAGSTPSLAKRAASTGLGPSSRTYDRGAQGHIQL